MDTTSYFHLCASALTPVTICSAVRVGPDTNWRCSRCPVASILTCVPPTSTTSTFMRTRFHRNGLRIDKQDSIRHKDLGARVTSSLNCCAGPPFNLGSIREPQTMKSNTLPPELLDKMDAYWRAANY